MLGNLSGTQELRKNAGLVPEFLSSRFETCWVAGGGRIGGGNKVATTGFSPQRARRFAKELLVACGQTVAATTSSVEWVAVCISRATRPTVASTVVAKPARNTGQVMPRQTSTSLSVQNEVFWMLKMVGAERFELSTFCTPSKRATSLRYAPMEVERGMRLPVTCHRGKAKG